MRIAIIGGGISGCAAYLQLRKHLPRDPSGEGHRITIYEAYDTPAELQKSHHDYGIDEGPTHSSTLVVGGSLGVGANGLNVLKRLDEGLLHDIVRRGYSCPHAILKSKSGGVLARMTAGTHDKQGKPKMSMLGCSRHGLWAELRRRIPDEDVVATRVAGVTATRDGPNVVEFVDGDAPAEVDLVVGADGLKSVTKRAIFPGSEDVYPPHYEGLCGIGGFIPYSEIAGHIEPGSMNFVMGGNGFFGYFISESDPASPHSDSPYHISEPGERVAWWTTYSVEECPDPKAVDGDAVLEQLRQRYGTWTDPVVRKILNTRKVTSIYPTWAVPPLPTWERDGTVLVGDAAHALPSTSGQGSSQALEDVECLAMFLGHSLRELSASSGGQVDARSQKEAIKAAAKLYMGLRQPRVTRILEDARKMQDSKRDKGVLEEYMMYSFLWVMGWFPNAMSRPMREVAEYDMAKEVQEVIYNIKN